MQSLGPGVFATKDIALTAGDLADYVDAVLQANGTSKVDMVGHSQGGLLARQYLKFNGEAGIQQVYDSPLLTELNADGDTVPGVNYTAIGYRYDTTTTPYETTFLTAGPGATVENIVLQDGCEQDMSGLTYSPRVIDLVRNALSPGSVEQARCEPVAPST